MRSNFTTLTNGNPPSVAKTTSGQRLNNNDSGILMSRLEEEMQNDPIFSPTISPILLNIPSNYGATPDVTVPTIGTEFSQWQLESPVLKPEGCSLATIQSHSRKNASQRPITFSTLCSNSPIEEEVPVKQQATSKRKRQQRRKKL